MKSDPRIESKLRRDEKLIKHKYSKKFLLASGLVLIRREESAIEWLNFLPENPEEICHKLRLMLQEKQSVSNSKGLDDVFFAKSDLLSELKCITSTEHKIF